MASTFWPADMLAHAELRAIEGHTCLGCHVGPRHGTVMHASCNRCHLGLARGTFFRRDPDDDASVCQSCHLKH